MDRIGGYEIISVLGHGGMGMVRRARDRRLDRVVAIKQLHSHLALDEEVKARFKTEAVIRPKLHHPNIVNVYDFIDADGTPVIVMEHMDGGSLAEVVDSRDVKFWEDDRAVPC